MSKKRTEDRIDEGVVGVVVGESTNHEFHLEVRPELVREQDILTVETALEGIRYRIWAKVRHMQRSNPLYPREKDRQDHLGRTATVDQDTAGEWENVTARCRVLGSEVIGPDGRGCGRVERLRYPLSPASEARRPGPDELSRFVLNNALRNLPAEEWPRRAINLATLCNRPDVDVRVDGHAIVSRHLAILAMTGAGKSWTTRTLLEHLAAKNYPMVIFDPHGEYASLGSAGSLQQCTKLYHAELPVLDEDEDNAAQIVEGLSGTKLSEAQKTEFTSVFQAGQQILREEHFSGKKLSSFIKEVLGREIGVVRRDLLGFALVTETIGALISTTGLQAQHQTAIASLGFADAVRSANKKVAYGILTKKIRRAGAALHEMEESNLVQASKSAGLPADRGELVKYGQLSVISLGGYTPEFQATLYTLIARDIFRSRVQARVQKTPAYPCLLVLEEAHTFVPGQSDVPALAESIRITKQIAQEGRKFGVGLVLISQRPSRLDETTLAQCNSFVILRMVNPADQQFVSRVVETIGEEEASILPDLNVGEALLSGQMVNFPVLAHINASSSTSGEEERDAFLALEDAHQRASPKGAPQEG